MHCGASASFTTDWDIAYKKKQELRTIPDTILEAA